jgi:hypothetical protein
MRYAPCDAAGVDVQTDLADWSRADDSPTDAERGSTPRPRLGRRRAVAPLLEHSHRGSTGLGVLGVIIRQQER